MKNTLLIKNLRIGDKVRCINTSSTCLRYGKVYEVSGFNPGIGGVLLKEFPDNPVGFFPFRFELEPAPCFNPSTATDQELADEYRKQHTLTTEIETELCNRGFHIYNKFGQQMKTRTLERRIEKKEVTTISL